MSPISGWRKVSVPSPVHGGQRYVFPPRMLVVGVLRMIHRGVRCAAKRVALFFDAAIASENIILPALGNTATGSALRSSLRVFSPDVKQHVTANTSFVTQVRSHRRDTVVTTFRGETGSMVPIVSCQEHETSKRELYDVCETDDTGEVISGNLLVNVLFAHLDIDRAASVLPDIQTSTGFSSSCPPSEGSTAGLYS
jgi:hypothetical protein